MSRCDKSCASAVTPMLHRSVSLVMSSGSGGDNCRASAPLSHSTMGVAEALEGICARYPAADLAGRLRSCNSLPTPLPPPY